MDQQSFIYKFLLAPRFRIWRHIALVFFFTSISVNQSLTGYERIIPVLGKDIYVITAITLLIYIVIFYIILYVFIDKYLLTGKYIQFVFCILIAALIFEVVPNVVFIMHIDGYDFFSTPVFVDNMSSYAIYLLCISGVIIPVFLRNWMASSQRLNQLEQKQILSEVDQLKEQVNPSSFFKVLDKTSVLVKSNPDKASAMLMKLSQLLRYQLYDCNREQVLLKAEISFLRNYLELENMYSSRFNYTITENDINTVFVAPTILLPYVQSAVNIIENSGESGSLDIYISNNKGEVCVILKITGIYEEPLLNIELEKVRERLETLCRNHYRMAIADNRADCRTEIILKLDNNK